MLRSTEPIDHALAAPPGSDGALSPSGAYIVETASSLSQPPQLIVRSALSGEVLRVCETADASGLAAHVAPHALPPALPFVTIAADGETEIHGVIQRPRHFDPTRSYPIVDTCCTHAWPPKLVPAGP